MKSTITVNGQALYNHVKQFAADNGKTISKIMAQIDRSPAYLNYVQAKGKMDESAFNSLCELMGENSERFLPSAPDLSVCKPISEDVDSIARAWDEVDEDQKFADAAFKATALNAKPSRPPIICDRPGKAINYLAPEQYGVEVSKVDGKTICATVTKGDTVVGRAYALIRRSDNEGYLQALSFVFHTIYSRYQLAQVEERNNKLSAF